MTDKHCVDCKHHSQATGWTTWHWCNAPQLGINPVTGKQETCFCTIMRMDFSGLVRWGESGRLFEPIEFKPKQEKVSWLQRLKTRLCGT